MPRPTATDIARRQRDSGLSRLRRLTVTLSLGAAGLTVVASLLAATTIPGRSSSATQPSQPSSDSGNAGTSSGDSQQPGLTSPNQPPQAGSGGGSVAVSGGS